MAKYLDETGLSKAFELIKGWVTTNFASITHGHGNITNGGDITATSPTIASGDKLIINDESESKITNGPSFGSDTTKYLRNDGTWAAPPGTSYTLPTATNSTKGGVTLSDATNGTETAASGGKAATPKAVADALTAAKNYTDSNWVANSSSSDGYVPAAGSTYKHRMWATNNTGAPDWMALEVLSCKRLKNRAATEGSTGWYIEDSNLHNTPFHNRLYIVAEAAESWNGQLGGSQSSQQFKLAINNGTSYPIVRTVWDENNGWVLANGIFGVAPDEPTMFIFDETNEWWVMLPTSTSIAQIYKDVQSVMPGTVTSIQVQATSPVQSSQSSAQTSTLNTTISLANGYGDTKNPYGNKDANKVLAGPSSGNAAAPSFRALVSGDIPNLAASKITSGTFDIARIPITGSVADGNTGLVTGDAVYDAIQDALGDVAGALVYKGTAANASAISGTSYKKGWYWIASTTFALTSGINVEPGDMIIAKQDKTSTFANDIDVVQTNIDTLTTAEVTALWNAA